MRAVVDREIVVRVYVDDDSGRLVDPEGTPTVSVTDGAGAVVGGLSAVTEESEGVWKATIPARTELDRLSVTWTVTVDSFARLVRQYVDVQSERLVPMNRLREDAEMADLPDEALRRIQDAVEAWFTRALGYPPIVVGRREKWLTGWTAALSLPRVVFLGEVYSLEREGVAIDPADYEITENKLYRSGNYSFLTGIPAAGGWEPGTYEAHYSHGLAIPEEDLRRAGAIFGRYISRTNNYPERARRVISAETEIVFSMPDPERPTGLPEVDAVVSAMNARSRF